MNIQEIKQRTKSVKNTLQITKAMELIASIKMKKAIEVAEKSRKYSDKAAELLSRLADEGKVYKHPLLTKSDKNKSLLIVVSSDKGLCGSHNSEIFKICHQLISDRQQKGKEMELITVGSKARNHFSRIKDLKIIADFGSLGDTIEYLEASPIGQLIIDEFGKGEYSEIDIAYKKFESMIKQTAEIKKVLPLDAIRRQKTEDRGQNVDPSSVLRPLSSGYQFEPEPEKVLDMVLPQLVKMMVFQSMLESNASEHAARMVAMKNATDAGKEIVQDLEFTYNRLRQEKITSEIAEIASGAEALSTS